MLANFEVNGVDTISNNESAVDETLNAKLKQRHLNSDRGAKLVVAGLDVGVGHGHGHLHHPNKVITLNFGTKGFGNP